MAQPTSSIGGTGPVGTGDYVIEPGDCIESIAYEHGLFWETLWNHPDNQPVKRERQKPNVLLPGDRLVVPPIRIKQQPCATEKLHCFRRKGIPSQVRVVLRDSKGQPRANLDYNLSIDGMLFSGKTDGQGMLRHAISPGARKGKIVIVGGMDPEEYELGLGQLDPITEVTGLQSRLRNLGYECIDPDGVIGPSTEAALQAFQTKFGLTPTGKPNDPTRNKLIQEHGA
jgi:hypothetical protein